MDRWDKIDWEPREQGVVDAAPRLHAEFIFALESELAANHAADRREAITLPRGEPVEWDGVFTAYRFELKYAMPHWIMHGPHYFQECGGLARHVRPRLSGTQTLVMHFREDSPSPILAGALLWPDSGWMIRGLIDRLTEVDLAVRHEAACDPPFHLDMAWAALGLTDAQTSQVTKSELESRLLDLNADQQSAVLHALGSRAHFVWGPPGSGKTRTVASAVVGHFRLGRDVLIGSPTHAASDLVLEHVCKSLSNEAGFGSGLIIRLGAPTSDRLQPEHADAVRYDRVLARQLASLRQEEERLLRETADLEGALEGSLPAETDQQRKITIQLADLRKKTSAVRARIDDLPEALLREARIISGTLHGIILTRRLRRSFDAIVMDEAPMAALPLVYAVSGLARSHVLLAGDHMQLPTPVVTADPRAQAALITDPFLLSGHIDQIERGLTPESLSILRTQYRMHPDLCRVVGSVFYYGQLSSGRTSDLAAPVIVLNTSELRPQVRGVRGSRENLMHAAVVATVVSAMLAKQAAQGRPPPELAILAPYRAQCRLIRSRITHKHPGLHALISTVHAAQGSEQAVVILDLTDAAGLGVGPFLRANSIHAVGARLLNTALSRARDRIIVVADVDFVFRQAGSAVRKVLERLIDVGRTVPASDVLRRSRDV